MSVEAWELVFMMVVLKLPIAYLVGVVWWAVRAAPDPYEPATLVRAQFDPGPPAACDWRAATRRRHPPRGGRPVTRRAARVRP